MTTDERHPPSDASRLRAIKRRVWPARWTFQAATAAGLESSLEREVAELLPEEARTVASGQVRVEAPFDSVYLLALGLRTADALRIRIDETAAASFPMVRDHLGRVDWPWWLPDRCRLEVEVRSRRSRLRDDAGLERVLRQAVRDHGIDDTADRGDAPTFRLRLDLRNDRAEVWIDVAGDPLHKRRGDRHVVRGALRETTAAALAMAARAEGADLIVDPFCGAGTVLEEAGAWVVRACPGASRAFALQASPVWNEGRMRHAMRTHCDPGTAGHRPPTLIGRDVSERAVEAARHNLSPHGWTAVDLAVDDARSLEPSAWLERTGAQAPLLLSNPPYGRRADAHGATPHALLAQVFGRFAGWRFGIVFPEPDVVAEMPGVVVEDVIAFRMRGLPNALVTGRIGSDTAKG